MSLYTADKNRVGFKYESGTYLNPTGSNLNWIGLVQSHIPEETPNVLSTRYTGRETRDVGVFLDGALDFGGTMNYFAQNWKMLQFAAGSMGTANGSVHTFTFTNSNDGNQYTSGTRCPFMSFTLEDSWQNNPTGLNFIRTSYGCMINTMSISSSQGEPVNVDINYIAGSGLFTSGAVTAMTADEDKKRVAMWSHSKVQIPSGTNYNEVVDWNLGLNNSLLRAHYCNANRTSDSPIPLNRDNTFDITVHGQSANAKTLYNQYYIGGSEFNAILDVTVAGSLSMKATMSGCKIPNMVNPSEMEGVNTQTVSITPKTVTIDAVDNQTYIGF